MTERIRMQFLAIKRQIARSGPTLASTGATAAMGLIAGVVLARQLGPSGRGEVAAVVSWISVLSVAGDFGIGIATSYFVAKFPYRRSLLWTQALFAAGAAGSVLAASAFAILTPRLHLGAIHAWAAALGFSAIPLLMAASHQGYLLLGAGRIAATNRIRLVSATVYLVGVSAAAAVHAVSPDLYIAVFWLAQLTSCAVAFRLCATELHTKIQLGTGGLKELLLYGAKTQSASLSSQVSLRLDQLVMSLWLGHAELGIYVVAVALSSIVGPLYTAGALVVTPAVLHAESETAAATLGRKYLMFIVVTGTVMALLAIVASQTMLVLFFGDRFDAALGIARILLVASVFQGTNQVTGAILRARGRPGVAAIGECAGLVATIVLLKALLPRFGAIGAAVTSLVAYALVSVAQVAYLVGLLPENDARLSLSRQLADKRDG